MKLEFNRLQLLNLVNNVFGFCSEKTTLPILSHFLFSNKDGVFSITSNDMELQGIVSSNLGIVSDFAFTVPAKKLKDSINALENEFITLDLSKQGKVVVKGGKTKFTLQTLDSHHFPLLKKDNGEIVSQFNVNTIELFNALNLTNFAQGVNDSRVFLNASLFEIKDSNLNIVATDAHRLSKYTITSPTFTNDFQQVIPRNTIAQILKLSGISSSDLVNIKVYVSQVVFNIGDIEIISKVIDGKYPDYNRVIPTNNTLNCNVSTKDLLNAIRRISLIGFDKLRAINFSILDNIITLTNNNDLNEESNDEVVCKTDFTNNVKMSFNQAYWVELLSRIPSDDIKVELYDNTRSVRVLLNDESSSFIHIIMPLRS